jgi:hypothetical protein
MGWPLEFSPFQSSVVKPKAIVLPMQDLQLISIAVTENKEAIREGIQLEPLLDQHG